MGFNCFWKKNPPCVALLRACAFLQKIIPNFWYFFCKIIHYFMYTKLTFTYNFFKKCQPCALIWTWALIYFLKSVNPMRLFWGGLLFGREEYMNLHIWKFFDSDTRFGYRHSCSIMIWIGNRRTMHYLLKIDIFS